MEDHNPAGQTATVHWESISEPLDLLALHRLQPERYPHLLESAARGDHGRFDILFAFPGESLTLDHKLCLREVSSGSNDFLTELDRRWERERVADHQMPFPFHGGWFLYLGYELASQVEPTVSFPAAPGSMPVALATRFHTAIVRDHDRDCLWLVAEAGREALLAELRHDVENARQQSAMDNGFPLPAGIVEAPAEHYCDAVNRVLGYIREGDVFQANLSRRWTAGFNRPPDAAVLYDRLRRRNPGPFNGIAAITGATVISSSPERLVEVVNGKVNTRPIAGTRPRGAGESADIALSDELLAHPKERAEHVMLIDLERNDIGRVCKPGTVEVNELMTLESYAHVHHIVSNVRGELRDDVTPGQVIRAVFPGGTITGCPKVRCMEIIAELEGEGRGAYTGSMGYLNRDGSLDLNILIRTLVLEGGEVSFRAGAGIVFDSVPEQELAETRAKARGMVLALEDEQV